MTAPSMPVVRLSSPADIAAAIPHLCGFVPTESLVAVSLRGERRRIGLSLRIDLLPAEADAEVATEVAARLVHDGASAMVLVVYTGEAGRRPYEPLVRAVMAAAELRGITTMEGLLVREGMWSSFTCDNPDCCPSEGTPMVPATPLLAAAAAFDGRAVLKNRTELVASIAAPARTPELEHNLNCAAVEFLRNRQQDRHTACTAAHELWRGALTGPYNSANLIVTLGDLLVRDEIATWALDESEALLALLMALVREAVSPYDVPVCTLIALVAWVRGDGALANVALDRALTGNPEYTMAKLFRTGLDGQLPPSAVKSWLVATRKVLHG